MLFLPECFGFMGENSQQTLEQAEPPIMNDSSRNTQEVQDLLKSVVQAPSDATTVTNEAIITDGSSTIPLLDELTTIAKESDLWISAGGMHESSRVHLSLTKASRACTIRTSFSITTARSKQYIERHTCLMSPFPVK